MKAVEVIQKSGLIDQSEPVVNTEERGGDDHRMKVVLGHKEQFTGKMPMVSEGMVTMTEAMAVELVVAGFRAQALASDAGMEGARVGRFSRKMARPAMAKAA